MHKFLAVFISFVFAVSSHSDNAKNISSVMLIGEENNNFIVPNWRSSANSLIVNKGDIIRIIYAANPYMVDTTLLVRPEATEPGCKYVIKGM